MKQKCFDVSADNSDQAIDQFANDLSQLRQARKLRPCPFPELLRSVDLIMRLGMKKRFSYSELAEALARDGGLRVDRLKLRRFVAKYLPDVFRFRSQFKFNRNVAIAKENKDECKK